MNNIVVIGSGTMGNGIAHTFAQYGFTTTMVDINDKALVKAIETITKNLERMVTKGTITDVQKSETLARLSTSTNLEGVVEKADLIVEAASEKFEIKAEIFKKLDTLAKESCILASNTSSIPITKIAACTQRPHNVIGMHFMNPVPVMKLVEVIRGYATSQETCNTILEISKKLNKIPTEVNDYPGFISNRILMPMINEAICSLYEGVAGVEEIDTVMKLGMAHPMGPLQLADFIGLDVCLNIMNVLFHGFGNPKYAPSPLLVNMVTAGHLGVKSGKGFYVYTAGVKELVIAERFKK
jgi:3-hydroxybutyryl-CoA dehydrogenase